MAVNYWTPMQHAFCALPTELFLNVLDQLVGSHHGQVPIAYERTHIISQTLRALALVSRRVNPIALRYLFSYCLHLDNYMSYILLCRTLGPSLEDKLLALKNSEADRNDEPCAGIVRYVTSVFISIEGSGGDETVVSMFHLPQFGALFATIGPTLKRLALDLQPLCATALAVNPMSTRVGRETVLSNMLQLDELVASSAIVEYFSKPPPNLKRLAITSQELKKAHVDFCFSISSLQTLIFLRPPELAAVDVELVFQSYKGNNLDLLLIDVNSNHQTPRGMRCWDTQDRVKIWEVDVPTSFYGDEDELSLCCNFIWTHGVKGTLWSQEKRRMISWAEVQRRLVGPVHFIIDSTQH